ncbi:MAG: hypothetical protein LBE13_03790, partial [Bacteroidales bacterium]|nr:hypothetical protein [Bacteroidales bacterium]
KTNKRQARRDNNNDYTNYFEALLALQTTYEIAIATADETYYNMVIVANTDYNETVTEADKKYDENYCQLTGQYYDTLLTIDTGGTVDGTFYNNGTSSLNVQVCFPAGTPVILADGTTKNIEDILPDDLVKTVDCQNPDSTIIDGRVVRVFQNDPQPLWHLNFGTFEIRATKEHPFYVKGKGWVIAEELQIGDVCRSVTDTEIILVAKELESEPVPVFNFEVQNTHTYFVGENGTENVLVHNECTWQEYFYNGFWGLFDTKLDKVDAGELADQINQARKDNISKIGKGLETAGEIATSINPLTVALETVTGDRMTSSDGEKVSASERILNIATSTAGVGFLGAGVKVSGKLATKIDNIVSKIPGVYKANLKCADFANTFIKALKKEGINGKSIELSGNKRGYIICKSYESGNVSISETGKHIGVQVGDKVYDNLHPNGIPFDQWIKEFDSIGGIKIVETIDF